MKGRFNQRLQRLCQSHSGRAVPDQLLCHRCSVPAGGRTSRCRAWAVVQQPRSRRRAATCCGQQQSSAVQHNTNRQHQASTATAPGEEHCWAQRLLHGHLSFCELRRYGCPWPVACLCTGGFLAALCLPAWCFCRMPRCVWPPMCAACVVFAQRCSGAVPVCGACW